MVDYKKPSFDFSAPLDYVKRMEPNESVLPGYRSEFMRDRDRVMYCSSFRRLAGKTQVYLAGKDDHKRNRLTHTLEVSQISRTISHALGLDCDLTEAIALGHDLGHTPFGHAGEQVLHEIMVPNSKIKIESSPLASLDFSESPERLEPILGFKHNVQSLRIAAYIEDNYGVHGLNLTNYTLWGILHHSGIEYKEGRVNTNIRYPNYLDQYNNCLCMKGSQDKQAWSFEAFVVREADEIAQWHHDLEDAIRGGAMDSKEVCNTIKRNLKEIMNLEDLARLEKLADRKRFNRRSVADLSRIVVNTLVNRLIDCSLYNLDLLWNNYVGDVSKKEDFFQQHDWNEPEISRAIKLERIEGNNNILKTIEKNYPSVISEKIHHSLDVERMNAKGQYIIKKLFQAYYSHPQQLPDGIIIRYMIDINEYVNLQSAEKAGVGAVRVKLDKLLSDKVRFDMKKKIILMRKICDHIAGMTDHYAIEEYNNLYG